MVGHQTCGKSALLEALLGFQYNQVGGGTKTRRPIALRMQYNPACSVPRCYLMLDNGKEELRSLADIQVRLVSSGSVCEVVIMMCRTILNWKTNDWSVIPLVATIHARSIFVWNTNIVPI